MYDAIVARMQNACSNIVSHVHSASEIISAYALDMFYIYYVLIKLVNAVFENTANISCTL